MRATVKGIQPGMLAISMILIASVGVFATSRAADNEKDAREVAYLENIITVLRAHVQAMRSIIDHNDMKYADNMVRHARAFKRAVGMVGPMDWHATGAFEKAQKANSSIEITEAEFEKLAKASHQKVQDINRAANRYMEDEDGEHMSEAINNMINSCIACHSIMPMGTAPSVWNDMKE
ncbi:MAG: cytochrome c [Gammaproteobacteria bacterium]|nr:cytochrome c [Gammaproteobacteria bacterium]